MEILTPRNKVLVIYALKRYQKDLEYLFSKHSCKCKPSEEQCIHDHELDSTIEDIKELIGFLEQL